MEIIVPLLLVAAFIFWRARRRKKSPLLTEIVAPPGAYKIEYADASGEITQRAITVRHVEAGSGSPQVVAHCHLRGDQRNFRADRILTLHAPDGSIISDPVGHFAVMAEQPVLPSPEHEAVMRRARPGLEVLLWIARADRELSESEIGTALAYVVSRSGLTQSTSAEGLDRAAARVQIEAMRPTFDSAVGALARMAKRGSEYALVLRSARAIVGASEAGATPAAKRFARLFPDH